MASRAVRGFTLIEMMVVIAVLGVLLVLVVPRLGDLGEANLKRTSRHLTGMIRFLRDESQARKAVFRIRFDVQAGTYWAEVLTQTGENTTGEQTMEFKRFQSEFGTEGGMYGSTTLRDVMVASHPDDPYIQITPDGWVESSLIHLRDGNDRDFSLIVRPVLADPELREGYVEEQ